jgi:hypothetical protein
MRVGSVGEAGAVLKNCVMFRQGMAADIVGMQRRGSWPIVSDSRRLVSIARVVGGAAIDSGSGVFVINEYGIWPSSEDYNLFRRFRQSLGESRALHDAPAHFFDSKDNDDLVSLITMTLLFSWGAVLACGDGVQYVVAISHDEFIDLWAQATMNVDELSKSIAAIMKP